MALTTEKLLKIMKLLERNSVDDLYQDLINGVLDAILVVEKNLSEKLIKLEVAGEATPLESAEILAEVRWQALSAIAAKAGLDRGLRESSVSNEILQKYESLSNTMLTKSIIVALTNLKQQDLNDQDSAMEEDQVTLINDLLSKKKKVVLN